MQARCPWKPGSERVSLAVLTSQSLFSRFMLSGIAGSQCSAQDRTNVEAFQKRTARYVLVHQTRAARDFFSSLMAGANAPAESAHEGVLQSHYRWNHFRIHVKELLL